MELTNFITPRNVSSVGSERCFDRAEVTGSSPVRSTVVTKIVLFILLLSVNNLLFAQRNLIVEYGKYFKLTSKITNKEVEGFDYEGTLYVQGDSLTFFTLKPQMPDIKRGTIGRERDHHALYAFPKLQRTISENFWTHPFGLMEYKMDTAKWHLFEDTLTVMGYLCKAAARDAVRVWYAVDIPVASGPFQYFGLPGIVLMVENLKYKRKYQATSIRESKYKIVIPKAKFRACKDCDSKIEEIKKYFPD